MALLSSKAIALLTILLIADSGAAHLCLQCPSDSPRAVVGGQVAQFVCSAETNFAYWIADGCKQDTDCFRDRLEGLVFASEISQSDNGTIRSVFTSRLDLPANTVTHGVDIVCYITKKKGGSVGGPTDPVKLLVQGPYPPVNNVTFANTSLDIHMVWAPPYHYEGVPPTQYNITITDTNTSDVLFQHSTEVLQYNFALQPHLMCSVLNVEIQALRNELVGVTSSIKWSLGGFVEPQTISRDVQYFNGLPLLTVTFKVVGYCFQLLANLSISVTCGTDLFSRTAPSSIQADSGVSEELELTVTGLPEDVVNCSFIITLESKTGRVTPSNPITFSTFIKEVIIHNGTKEFCVQCVFVQGTTARGCSVRQQRGDMSIMNYTISRERPEQCYSTDPGLYSIAVHGIKTDGNETDTPFITKEITVADTPKPVLQSAMPSTGAITPTKGEINVAAITSGATAGAVFVLVLLAVPIIIAVVLIVKKEKRKKSHQFDNSRATETDGIDGPLPCSYCSQRSRIPKDVMESFSNFYNSLTIEKRRQGKLLVQTEFIDDNSVEFSIIENSNTSSQ